MWRTCGGKHRALLGLSEYCIPEIDKLHHQIKDALDHPVTLTLDGLRADNLRLAQLVTKYANYHDALDIWHDLGVSNPEQVSNLSDAKFQQLQQSLAE